MMMKPALLALAGLLAATSVARAEDDATPTPTPTAPSPTPMAPSSGGPFQKGAMGISSGIAGTSLGSSTVVDFAYFLNDKAAIDILAGLVFVKTPNTAVAPAPDNSSSAFGFSAGIGYRMYTTKGQTIHTYLQPFGLITSSDVSDIGNTFGLRLGVNFGAEAFVNDWLSFRGQVGAELDGTQKFKQIAVGTTSGAFVNVYWK